MKKIKLSIMTVTALTIFSCGNNDVSCNSTIAKTTVKSIWKDGADQNRLSYQLNGLNADAVNSFIDNYMEIEQVRTLSKDEALKKCECAGKVIFNVPKEIKEDISKIKNEGGIMGYALMEGYTAENGIDIEYNIQETDDGEIYAETYLIENLSDLIMFYQGFITKHKNNNRKGEVIVWTPVKEGFGGDYTMKFIENNKVEMHYKYIDFEYTEFLDYNPTTDKLTTDSGWEQFKFDGNRLIVEDKEGEFIYKRK